MQTVYYGTTRYTLFCQTVWWIQKYLKQWSRLKTVCPICIDCAFNILPATVSIILYSQFFHMTSMYYINHTYYVQVMQTHCYGTRTCFFNENRLAKSKANKNRHVQNRVSYLDITFVSCHDPKIECKGIPYQV